LQLIDENKGIKFNKLWTPPEEQYDPSAPPSDSDDDNDNDNDNDNGDNKNVREKDKKESSSRAIVCHSFHPSIHSLQIGSAVIV
jgi:hypothetical protein